MLETFIAIVSLSIGFIIGAVIVAIALYPQLVLLRSMLVDKHTVEVRRSGLKTSAVKGVEAPVSVPFDRGDTELSPPDLFRRRASAEAEELKQKKSREEMLRLVNDMQ